MGLSISQKSASALDRLVRLVAAEKNPHQLISRIAADSALIDEIRRVCRNLQESEWTGRQEFRDLCRQYRVTPEYFEEKLWFIANILHLTEHEHDYYEILEVPRTASQREIKQAFRRLSLISHPDVNPHDPDAVERFRELLRAYEVLSDHGLRRHFDQKTALTEWPAESSQAAQIESSRRGWWRWRYLAPLAVVVALLVAVCFLVDYQEWAADRYYRTKEKQRHEAAVSVAVREPGVGNDSSKASAPLPEPVSENRAGLTASAETLVASDPNEIPKIAPASVETLVASDRNEVPKIAPASVETLVASDRNEVPKVAAASEAVSKGVHGGEAKQTVKEQPAPSLTPAAPATPAPLAAPATPANTAQYEASPRRAKIETPQNHPALPQKLQKAQGTAGPAQSAGESAEPEQIDLFDPASPGKVLSVEFHEQQLNDFLHRYAKAYEKKELGTLMRFFAADALENGEPIASLVPVYQKNFQRAEMIHYQIQMTQYTAIEDRVKIRGAFRLKSKFAGERVRESAGSIQLTLAHEGNAFRIKRLDYQFANPEKPARLKQ